MVFTMRGKLALLAPAGTTIALTQAHTHTQSRSRTLLHTDTDRHTHSHSHTRLFPLTECKSMPREGENGMVESFFSSLAFVAVVLVGCRHQDLLASHSVTVADFGASFKTRKSDKAKRRYSNSPSSKGGGSSATFPPTPRLFPHPLCSRFLREKIPRK